MKMMSEISFKILQGKVAGAQIKRIGYKLVTAKASYVWVGIMVLCTCVYPYLKFLIIKSLQSV